MFYTLEKSWTSAKDLEPGDTVVTLSGEKYKIEAIDKDYYDGIIVVYNFEVEDNHNYYVGDNQVLVHNDGCTVSDKGSSVSGKAKTRLSDQLPKELNDNRDIVKEYDAILIGQGVPNLDKTGLQKTIEYRADSPFTQKWVGAKEWYVMKRGKDHAVKSPVETNHRILTMHDSKGNIIKMGYVVNHTYKKKVVPFPLPWFNIGG